MRLARAAVGIGRSQRTRRPGLLPASKTPARLVEPLHGERKTGGIYLTSQSARRRAGTLSALAILVLLTAVATARADLAKFGLCHVATDKDVFTDKQTHSIGCTDLLDNPRSHYPAVIISCGDSVLGIFSHAKRVVPFRAGIIVRYRFDHGAVHEEKWTGLPNSPGVVATKRHSALTRIIAGFRTAERVAFRFGGHTTIIPLGEDARRALAEFERRCGGSSP